MEMSKLVCTQADMTNLKDRMQRIDIVDVCTRERANSKWTFYKLTNLTIFASWLKDVPMGCEDTVLFEPLLKNHNVNCLAFERTSLQPYNDNLCLFRALVLYLHGNKKLEEESSKFSTFSSITVSKETFQPFEVFIWMTFQKLKTWCNSKSSFMTLILWTADGLVSCVEEVFESMETVSSFYATTITSAMSTTSTHSSKLSDVLPVTHFSQKREIWNDIWLLVVIVLNIFTQRMCTNWEKRFLKSWMHSTSLL